MFFIKSLRTAATPTTATPDAHGVDEEDATWVSLSFFVPPPPASLSLFPSIKFPS